MAAAAQLDVCSTTATACHLDAGFLVGFPSMESRYARVAPDTNAARPNCD
jgi:hypothetical protein